MDKALTLPLGAAGADKLGVEAIRRDCRAMVRRRARVAASVSFVPLPGVDLITDVAVLVNLLPEINARFGPSEAQVERLSPQRKALAYRLMLSNQSWSVK